MLFNTFGYFVFAITAFFVFLAAPGKWKRTVLLTASYFFYSFFGVKSALLLFSVSLVSFFFGITMRSVRSSRRIYYLWGAIFLHVATLVYFKYAEFIVMNVNYFLKEPLSPIHVIMPIGISFYIFQSLAYLFDIYLEKIQPEKHLGYFLLYLSFFPKLLQGPIERASQLIPQLKRGYVFNYNKIAEGVQLIIVGLVKKMVVADRLAFFVNEIFSDVVNFSGLVLVLASYIFTFQIYFDFSGYTDIARGLGKIFGIELSENFQAPYLATNIQEFWRKWHITFSAWLRDYLFTPLLSQFRNFGAWGVVGAVLITFAICGLWHGPAWGFVIFGLIHGAYMGTSILTLKKRNELWERSRVPAGWVRKWRIFVTFNMIALSFVFFRADSMKDAVYILTHLTGPVDLSILFQAYSAIEILSLIAAVALLAKSPGFAPAISINTNRGLSQQFYYGVMVNLLIFLGVKKYAPFIYFRF
ncbi:MAG: hypothetical protein A3D87_03550 [Omnitrophica WOR_2 bacterium RIFCSPHIGHO2_02_FULL_50_17]|nr:MAG: hypothetical protein A3D87_03550 [Omnitrophica WOR_2 bacterium RIFCSPHIGHO2_02_FULL_50_17]